MDRTLLHRTSASRDEGWFELARMQPAVARLVVALLLPLALVPPAMLYLAGTYYGDAIAQGYGGRPWAFIATVFLAAGVVGLTVMGWLIRQVAQAFGAQIALRDAYLLAAIAAVPLWASAFGLLVPSLSFNVGLSIVALALSCSLLYRGVHALCHFTEDLQAASVTQTVFGAGLLAWAVLLLLLVVFPG